MLKDIRAQNTYEILIIGETCLDVYVFGEVNRLSPEAPVPILKKKSKETKIGMSGNVCANIKSMIPSIKITKVSNDSKDIRKIRFIDKESNYQVLRYDIENEIKSLDISKIDTRKKYDAIVLSDYNKGLISKKFVSNLTKIFKDTKIFVDTKKTDLKIFKDCVIKINEKESKNLSISDRDNLDCIITLGSSGCVYQDEKYETKRVEVYDVCGAGDVFLAALVSRWLETKDMERSIKTANNCATLSVTKLGCYTVKREEYENLCV